MRAVISSAEMREIDRLTTERYGMPSLVLMENAAAATARTETPLRGCPTIARARWQDDPC